ncbi:F-box protein [Panicum miliaceum]|uniref:F-box protein n=1 Tax=Panicum miliaceum TaxID=4540 RepID=A0A3L6RSA5_PANMI|nr:F-box protein [Panicum miliaceum]
MAQADAAAFFRDAPPRVVIEIIRRLPARSVLRLRSVCKLLRDVASYQPLLAAVHLLHPPQPLICFGRDACPDRYIRLRDYCVEALHLHLRSDDMLLRPILRFTDNEYYDFIDNIQGADAPPIYAFSKDHIIYYGEGEEAGGGGQGQHYPRITVHASIDGLLLVSFINIWYICNPATRQWVALPDLSNCTVIGLYAHVSSGEYRVLVHTGQDDGATWTRYYVLRVGAEEARGIGRPIPPPATLHAGSLGIGLDPVSLSPPVQLRRNLHWPPQERQGYHMLVFDTEAEVFSWMSSPDPIISSREGSMQLLEMGRKLAMSVSKVGRPTLELWRLEDYRNEIWVQIYRIRIPVMEIPDLHYIDWFPHVVSPQGDVLIECSNKLLLHCDRNGNLLRKFQFREEAPVVRHTLKETLLPHAIFLEPKIADGDVEPPFFEGL